VFNTSGIDLWYRREGAVSTDITEADLATPALTDAHADGGFLHINDGWYRLDLPDAACAAGVTGVQIGGTVTDMVVLAPYIELVAYNPYDAVRLGLTALPNANADAAGGLPVSDAGGLDLDGLDTNVSAILVDTGEIGTAGVGLSNIPWNADWDTEVQSEVTDALNAYDPPTRAELTSDIGTVTTAISGLENISAADVNAQVVDVLNTDTFAEPGQGTPGATITLAAKIGYLYKAWRNRTTQTASEYALYADDATTKDQEAVVSDNGTTFERGEISTGA
jgi:hypothetical protein